MKKLLTVTMILFSISSSVNASSSHGDFEGNPIVSVKANGVELKVDDVPAINYKDRTMVPIYLLKQLGADVVWDNNTYSVNVNIDAKNIDNTKETDKTKENQNLRDAYQWLNDTDIGMWMFIQKLEAYKEMDTTSDLARIIDNDFLQITNQYNDSLAFALKMNEKYKTDNHLQDIMSVQSKAFDQIKQTMDLLKVWLTMKTDAQVTSSLSINMINALQSTQKNVANTKQYIHELMQKDSE